MNKLKKMRLQAGLSRNFFNIKLTTSSNKYFKYYLTQMGQPVQHCFGLQIRANSWQLQSKDCHQSPVPYQSHQDLRVIGMVIESNPQEQDLWKQKNKFFFKKSSLKVSSKWCHFFILYKLVELCSEELVRRHFLINLIPFLGGLRQICHEAQL